MSANHPNEVTENDISSTSKTENKTSSGAFSMIRFNMSMALVACIIIPLLIKLIFKVKNAKVFYQKKLFTPMFLIFLGMFCTGYYISKKAVENASTCSQSPKCKFVHFSHGLIHGLFSVLVYNIVLWGTYQKYRMYGYNTAKVDSQLKNEKVLELDPNSENKTLNYALNMAGSLVSPFSSNIYVGEDSCGVPVKKCQSGLLGSFYINMSKAQKASNAPTQDGPYYKFPVDQEGNEVLEKAEFGSVFFIFLTLMFYLIVLPLPLITIIYFNAIKSCK